MELTEPIESINQQLKDMFGIDSDGGEPIFRVVWSEDQYEKVMSKFTPEGLEMLFPQLMERPKYKQWIHEKYVLERLVLVPDVNRNELTTVKSYEPLWVFQDARDNYLPPIFVGCKFVIDTMYAALGKSSMRKYVDEEAKNPVEAQAKRIAELEEQLYGDESNFLGRTITGEAIAMPQEYGRIAQEKKDNSQ